MVGHLAPWYLGPCETVPFLMEGSARDMDSFFIPFHYSWLIINGWDQWGPFKHFSGLSDLLKNGEYHFFFFFFLEYFTSPVLLLLNKASAIKRWLFDPSGESLCATFPCGCQEKLRTDNSRDPDVNIVDPRLEMQLEFSHKAKWRCRYFQGWQSSLLEFLKIFFC